MKKQISFWLLLLILPVFSYSQNEIDALRYSQMYPGGTARSLSMGGSFGALGADFSVLSINPAGIAMFRKSEFTVTPSLLKQKTSSKFFGSFTTDEKYNFNFNNVGVAYSYPTSEPADPSVSGWRGWNFGMGYNRLNNFHNRHAYSEVNPDNSMLDYFAEVANRQGSYETLSPFSEGLAFDTYLIDTVPGSPNTFKGAVRNGGTLQERVVVTSGSIGEVLFAFGGNYSDRLYIGASVGFPFMRYKEEVSYSETDVHDTIPSFKSFVFNQSLNASGLGYNFKLGIVYRVHDMVRIGGAVHTPTFYNITEDYSASISGEFDDPLSYKKESPQGSFDYEVSTPLKLIGSIAFIAGKKGILNAEVEFVDYAEARLRANSESFVDENKAIEKKYTSALNYRVGAEYKLNQRFSLRGGYGFYASPFAKGLNPGADASRTNLSGGIGIREDKFFIDFGYVFSTRKEFFRAYTLKNEDVEGTVQTINGHNFLMTFGVKF